ncbi:MFS transporter [Streptomyces sp. NPDC048337]|uniref:MFS transporter n=1 Tax=Streptomyces sp. NPDC048337 TaxID=3365535 RepID=UPI003715AA9A
MSADTDTLADDTPADPKATESKATGPNPAAPLWTTNFRLYFGARTSSLLGDAMLPVALSVGLLEAGYGSAGVGYALGAWMGALALCMLFGGVLADRFTPRRMMVIADLARLVIQAAMALMFLTDRTSLWVIVLLQALSGAATALFQPGVASMVPQVAADVQRANGVLRIAESSAGVLGPALAGVLVGFSGAGTVFAIYAATYAISGGCLFGLRLTSATPAGEGSFLHQLATGWQEFRARSWLWGVISTFLLYGCFVAGVSLPVGADLVVDGLGSTGLGIAMAALGGGGVLGGLAAIKVRPTRPLAVGSIGWALFALNPAVTAIRPGIVLLCLVWALSGAGLAFWAVIWTTTVQTQIPAELLNRVYAYDVAGSLVSMALGRSLAGPLSSLTGQRPLMVFATLLGLLCTLTLLAVPAIRRLRAVPSGTPAAEDSTRS